MIATDGQWGLQSLWCVRGQRTAVRPRPLEIMLEENETWSFEVGGPEVFALNDIYREIAVAVGKAGKPLLHLPIWYGRILAAGFEWAARRGILPDPLLTRDQLGSLSRDSVADVSETERVFGGPWRSFREGIREYLPGGRRHDPRAGIGSEIHLEHVALLRVR